MRLPSSVTTTSLGILLGITLMLSHVSAQVDPSLIPSNDLPGCDFVDGDVHFACIPVYIAYLVQLLFGFIGTICLLQIIYAGYQIAMGGMPELGDKEKGKKRLTSALVGLAACVLSFVIVDMIVSALLSGPA